MRERGERDKERESERESKILVKSERKILGKFPSGKIKRKQRLITQNYLSVYYVAKLSDI